MAFPTVRATSQGSQNSNATSHTITLPTHVQGDLLVVFFSCDGNPTSITPSTDDSKGRWQQPYASFSSQGNVSLAVFYKIADSNNETLTLTTGASEQSTHISYAIIGGRIFSNAGLTTLIGSSTNSDPPASHAVRITADHLVFVCRAGDATVQATAAPTNYTNLDTQTASGSTGASIAVARRELNITSGSTEDPGTFTSATEQWVCGTLIIEEAPKTSDGLYFSVLGGGSEVTPLKGYSRPASLTSSQWFNANIQTLSGYGHSFYGTGGIIRKVFFTLKKAGTPPTLTAKIYAHSGTFGEGGTPTGSALATSTNTIAAADVSSTLVNAYEFNFDGFVALDGVAYFVVLETASACTSGNYWDLYQAASSLSSLTANAAGNNVFKSGGSWNSDQELDFGISIEFEPIRLLDVGASWASGLLSAVGSTPGVITESASATESQNGLRDAFPAITESSGGTADTPAGLLQITSSLTETATASETQVAGAVYNESITETASASESVNGLLTVSPSITEAASSSDAPSASLERVGSLTESGNGTESQQGLLSVFPAITEAGSATDAPNGTIVALPAITEAATATESTDATISKDGSITEAASATDAPNGLRTASPSITEAASATDAPNGLWTGVKSLTESGSATDTPGGLLVATPAITEAGTATETSNGIITKEGSVTESASATESQNGLRDASPAITEAASAAETQNGLWTGVKSQTEAASATDAPTGACVITASITEAASATEVSNGLVTGNIVETASATETTNGLRVATPAITESASATESTNGILVTTKSITEAGSATDAPAASLLRIGAMSEAGSATDSPNGILTAVGARTEAAAATDSPSGLLVMAPAVTEAASATESVNGIKDGGEIYNASLTESASASDSCSGAISAAVAVSEAATAQDSSGNALVTNASLSESVSAADVISAVQDMSVAIAEVLSAADSATVLAELAGIAVETANSLDVPSVHSSSEFAIHSFSEWGAWSTEVET